MTVSEEKTCPAQNGITGLSLGRYEGWKQTACWVAHAGSRLKQINGQKASSDMSALKPYWGKLTVRNFRGGYGNGGIMRSPLSAIVLLDCFDQFLVHYFRVGDYPTGTETAGIYAVLRP